MAVDFAGSTLSGVWYMLHDDNYLSDNRSIENGFVFIPHPPMPVLCPVYPYAARNVRCERHLFFTACSRFIDLAYMRFANKVNEAENSTKYGLIYV